ncbi:hypothetical protein D3C77_603570 [compost metagenome]
MNNIIERLKRKLKKQLREFLEVDTLESKLKQQDINMANGFSKHIDLISSQREWLNTHGLKITSLQNTISNVVSVGSDITPYGEGNSWAVVCIEGKYSVVKFFDLSHRDGREMLRLLRGFEGGRYVNDTPIGYFPKDLFVDW